MSAAFIKITLEHFYLGSKDYGLRSGYSYILKQSGLGLYCSQVRKLIREFMTIFVNGRKRVNRGSCVDRNGYQIQIIGDKNISILHLSCRLSDLLFSLVLQTHALVL